MRHAFIVIPLIFIISLLIGYFYFINYINKHHFLFLNNKTVFDGIAILTGGKGRIKEGLNLLEKNAEAKLIISGVDKKVTLKTITKKNNIFNNIYLDKKSKSTIENAIQITSWAKMLNLSKIKVITSYYHMPRSILFLKHYGKNITFIPHPVRSKNQKYNNRIDYFKLDVFLFEEYAKYLLSFLILVIY